MNIFQLQRNLQSSQTLLFQIRILKISNSMKSLLSLLWIFLTLLSILLILYYTSKSQNASKSTTAYSLDTSCLGWHNINSNQQRQQKYPDKQKFCVHCLNLNSIKDQIYNQSPIQFTLTPSTFMKLQFEQKQNKLTLLKIKKELNFRCQEYLFLIDTEKTLIQDKITFQNNQSVKRILKSVESQSETKFQLQKQKLTKLIMQARQPFVSKYVILQQARTLGSDQYKSPFMATANYLNKTFFRKNFQQLLNICLFALCLIGFCIFIIQKRRDGRLENYQNLLLGAILLYISIYVELYNFVDKIIISSIIWAILTWNMLMKLDNVDKNSYNLPNSQYFIISIIGGFSNLCSNLFQNKSIQVFFWGFFILYYLISYKIIIRIFYDKKRFENDGILSTLIYLIVMSSLIVGSIILPNIYGGKYFKEIQIIRFGFKVVIPLILVIMTFCQNDQKIQKFQQYVLNPQQNQEQKINAEPQ